MTAQKVGILLLWAIGIVVRAAIVYFVCLS